MSRPFPPRSPSSGNSYVRVNGKIRAREVRVVGGEGNQIGVIPLAEALNMARAQGVDLVEVAPNANPPVCRLVDYGKYRYEQSKKDKEAKKRQHANKVKEVQLSPSIDPHDFGVKLNHSIEFLCDEMKVKVTLRFRGREMAHKEFGFQRVQQFIKDLAPYGQPDSPPKLVGRGIIVMMSPLPRNKRAKLPAHLESARPSQDQQSAEKQNVRDDEDLEELTDDESPEMENEGEENEKGFNNNPFSGLDLDVKK